MASAGAHQAPDDIHLTPGISNGQYLLYCCGSLVFAALAHHGGFHSIARLFLAIAFYFFMFATVLTEYVVWVALLHRSHAVCASQPTVALLHSIGVCAPLPTAAFFDSIPWLAENERGPLSSGRQAHR